MTKRKKLLLAAGTIFGFVVAALLILPLLFKDRIAEGARSALGRAVDAEVDWGGLGVTFFRDFPNLTLTLRDLTVVGADPFQGDTLAEVGSFRVVLDLFSVVGALRERGPVVVRSIRVDGADVRLRVLEDGTANWDVMGERGVEAGPADEDARALSVALRSLELSNSSVVLDDEQSGLFATFEGLGHSLSGDLSRERVVVRTHTRADRTTVRFAGTPWLAGVALDFTADVDADLAERRFVFQDNQLRLNDLEVRFSGDAVQQEDGVAFDVAFAAPRTEFGQLLSLVPVMYARDFASLETSGGFVLEGNLSKATGGSGFPALALTATVTDGMFRYPDLPQPASAIAMDLVVTNPGGDVDSTVVDLRRFHIEIGGQPLDGSVTLRTPVSDPDVDGSVRGTLELADVPRTFKVEGIEEFSGLVTADATMRARLSDIDNARYDRVDARGRVVARNLALSGAALRQPVSVEEATVELSPSRADVRVVQARLGSSDLQATGWVDNLLGFVLRDEALHGSMTLGSSSFVLDEWTSPDADLEVIPVPKMLDLALDATIGRLTYGTLVMTNARGTLGVREERLTLDDFGFETLGGRIGVRGFYETTDPARPTFSLALALDSVDVARASEALLTVRTLAPVARYARGTFSADLDVTGALAPDLTPLFDVLDGAGSLLTSQIAVEGFPMMERLAEALKIPRLSNPTFEAIRSSVTIREGRLHVRPFQVGVGGYTMSVAGSNGFDQSLDYTLTLALPRAILGDAAAGVVQGLADRAGRAGLDVGAADSVRVGVRVLGTVLNPSLDLGMGEAVASVRQQVEGAAGAALDRRVDETRERADSAAEEARRRVQARADSIIARAEERAAAVRAEAHGLAEEIRAEGNRRADEVLARATNPLARRAAEPVAERIRKEADDRASQLEGEADERAEALLVEARARAEELMRAAGPGG